MTVEIKLDTNAMNALFPEGTEARVNLQKAVIANFAKTNLKPSQVVQKEVMAEIDKEAKKITEEVLRELQVKGPIRGWTDTWILKPEFEANIRKVIKEKIDQMIHSAVCAAEENVARIVKSRIDDEVVRQIRIGVSAKMDALKESL